MGKNTILRIISIVFTIWGIVMLVNGDTTNGLLAIIVGEIVDNK